MTLHWISNPESDSESWQSIFASLIDTNSVEKGYVRDKEEAEEYGRGC